VLYFETWHVCKFDRCTANGALAPLYKSIARPWKRLLRMFLACFLGLFRACLCVESSVMPCRFAWKQALKDLMQLTPSDVQHYVFLAVQGPRCRALCIKRAQFDTPILFTQQQEFNLYLVVLRTDLYKIMQTHTQNLSQS
jgi:hypothetical protein